MAINVKGVWLATQHEIPAMLATTGRGAIVNTSSIAGVVGFPQVPIYTASKHAVIGLTKAVALEYAQQNIRVNAVSPGSVETPMFERFTGTEDLLRAQLASMHPMGRIARPEDWRWLTPSCAPSRPRGYRSGGADNPGSPRKRTLCKTPQPRSIPFRRVSHQLLNM